MLAFVICFTVALIVLLQLSRCGTSRAAVPLRDCIESLEPRIAPAALTATFGGGTLKISGDAISNEVTLIQGGGVIEVFDGEISMGTFSGVKDIKADLDGPTDMRADLAAGGIKGSLKVKADGPDSLTLGPESSIGRSLSFTGDGADQLLVLGENVTLGKEFKFHGGKGTDGFVIGASSVIGGKTHFKAVENGEFDATSVIAIRGHLDFKNKSTPLGVNITTLGEAGLNVSGKVSYKGGKGNDTVLLDGSFDGHASFKDKSGNGNFGLGADSVVHGKLRVKTGSGDDAFNFAGGTVDKAAKLTFGKGDNAFRYGAAAPVTIVKGLTITAKSGADLWQSEGSTMKVGKSLHVKLGRSVDVIDGTVLVDGGKVSINTGSGVDSIALDGSAANSHLKVKLGKGDDSFGGSLFDQARSAHFDGGKGTDHWSRVSISANSVVVKSFEDFTCSCEPDPKEEPI